TSTARLIVEASSGSRDKIPACRFCRRKPNKMRQKLRPPKNTRCQPRMLADRNRLKARQGRAEDVGAVPRGPQKRNARRISKNYWRKSHAKVVALSEQHSISSSTILC